MKQTNIVILTALSLIIVWSEVVHAANTTEIITFKGIPLDTPGMAESLRALCLESDSNLTQVYGRPTRQCTKFEPGETVMWVNYGPVSRGIAHITLAEDLAVLTIEMVDDGPVILALAQTIAAKYGKPKSTRSQVQNQLGSSFDMETFEWTDSRGSRITVETMYDQVDKGRFRMESAKYLAMEKAAKKSLIDASKDNL